MESLKTVLVDNDVVIFDGSDIYPVVIQALRELGNTYSVGVYNPFIFAKLYARNFSNVYLIDDVAVKSGVTKGTICIVPDYIYNAETFNKDITYNFDKVWITGRPYDSIKDAVTVSIKYGTVVDIKIEEDVSC